jgi:ribosomal protein L7/L12
MIPPISDDDLQRITDTLKREGIIQAIKVFREVTGVGLAEAKAAVEAIRDMNFRTAASNVAASVIPPLTDALDQVRETLRRGNKIDAIKLYREITRSSLAAAKDAVEKMAVEKMSAGRPTLKAMVSGVAPRPTPARPPLPFVASTTQARPFPPPTASHVPPLPDRIESVHAALYRGNLVEAVRIYREKHGVDHDQARRAIESMMQRSRTTPLHHGSRTRRPSLLGRAVSFVMGIILAIVGVKILLQASAEDDPGNMFLWGLAAAMTSGFFFHRSLRRL